MAKHGIFDAPRGYTLLELMIVVSVIGLLALIAMPLYSKLLMKAHQAEAKSNLSGTHVAEVTYYGEWNRYGSFSEIGFSLAGTSARYTYRSPAAGGTAGSTGTANLDLLVPLGGSTTAENTFAPSGANLQAGATTASFTATATGNLDTDAALDQWHINEGKFGLDVPDFNDGA